MNTTNTQQRIAVIDLGSNTARLVVLRAVPGYAYHLDDEIREVVRLRQGMTAQGLSETAVARALFALRLFKRFCDSSQVDRIIPTATSAVREAANGAAFVERVQQEIGLSLQILDGEKEAYYGTLGALNEVPFQDGFVLDIGGGSMQLSQVQNRQFQRGAVRPLGALALTERFIRHDPVKSKEVAVVMAEIECQLGSIEWLDPSQMQQNGRLVGMGGTIRNMAKMAAKRGDYPLNTLHGYQLSRDDLAENIQQLTELPVHKRQKISGLSSDRADIILPGAMVLACVMDRLEVDSVTISVNGLREGLFFEHFWRHLSYPVVGNVRRFGVLNMARIYNYQKQHASHVRFLAGRLFDQLAPLHGYGRWERDLLDAAALLHDLGVIISYNDHHRHSQALIINSGLPGYTPREVALIALLTRYHRKGNPGVGEFAPVLEADDERRLNQLAAILRLAEFAERGRNANVDDVTAGWNDETLRLTLVADYYPAVEIWEAERNAISLLETAFEREIIFESTAAPDVGWEI